MRHRKRLIPLVTLAVMMAAFLASCGSSEPEDKTFNLEIQGGELVVGTVPLRVNQNDEVTIVVATDEHLSFHLHGYDIEREAEPGEPARLVFTANATGSFPFTIHLEGEEDDHDDDATDDHDDDEEEEEEEVELGRLNVVP